MREGQVPQRYHCNLSCPKLSVGSMVRYGESIGLLVGTRNLKDKGHMALKGVTLQGERCCLSGSSVGLWSCAGESVPSYEKETCPWRTGVPS